MTVYPNAIDGDAKKCSKCKLLKKNSEFGKSSKSTTGLKSACKECLRKQNKAYMAKKRSKMSISEREAKAKECRDWRIKKLKEDPDFWKTEYRKNHKRNLKNASKYYWNNREQKIKEMKIWRKNNPEKHRQAVKNWRKNNYEKMLASHRQWLKENANHVREYNRKRRAIKNKVTIKQFSKEELDQRMSVFGYQCAYCGGEFEHIDHVKPLSKGGPHCLSNLRPACKKCNLSKHNKNLYDWLEEVA
jgi:5-methylcytosine-specific restriction endonuclease McrA